MVTVTPKAAEKIRELMSETDADGVKYNPETVGLRVFVQGGGCSGFQYGMQLENDPNTDSDKIFESNGVRVFVDPISLRYLQDAEIDFTDNLTGGGFTVKNPNAKSTCGCGQSFQA